jgi:hypothetical protein
LSLSTSLSQCLFFPCILIIIIIVIVTVTILQYWGLNSGPYTYSATWTTNPDLFALGFFFLIGSHVFCWGEVEECILYSNPPFPVVSGVAGMTVVCHAQFICWDGGLTSFLPRLILNLSLPNFRDYSARLFCIVMITSLISEYKMGCLSFLQFLFKTFLLHLS